MIDCLHGLLQDTYALYLARDDGGAIAAFLDDGRVSTLQASVARNAANGQMAVRLTNSTDFPVGCQYQIMLTKLQPGPLTAADIPSRLNISSICSNPISRFGCVTTSCQWSHFLRMVKKMAECVAHLVCFHKFWSCFCWQWQAPPKRVQLQGSTSNTSKDRGPASYLNTHMCLCVCLHAASTIP